MSIDIIGEILIMKHFILLIEALLALGIIGGFFQCSGKPRYYELIENGEFKAARRLLREDLLPNRNLSDGLRARLDFELIRMDRIEKDFTLSEESVLEYIRKYVPEVTPENLRKWEAEKTLEYKIIDGQKRYFNNAQYNLFRLDKELKAIKEKIDAENSGAAQRKKFPLDEHIKTVIDKVETTGRRFVCPVKMLIKQSLIVDQDVVPAGEILRCWIPFPREIDRRQTDIAILSSEPKEYYLADNKNMQRTIYFEKPARSGEPTTFSVEYTYKSHGVYVPVDPEKVLPTPDRKDLNLYTRPRPPHLEFTNKMKELSRSIVGDEKNPYRIAQKLFAWVDTNITWASAREYSTFYNIPGYVIENRHGDCGMQTLTFMTLCRMNGIPVKWQSGWEFQPPDDSMHDWGEIYFEPYGWVPMDVTYGLRKTTDEKLKWFYLSGMDSYRLIFNDGFSMEFDPEKQLVRSETIDSQRGEVEWNGGNLYFDKWNWNLEWEILD